MQGQHGESQRLEELRLRIHLAADAVADQPRPAFVDPVVGGGEVVAVPQKGQFLPAEMIAGRCLRRRKDAGREVENGAHVDPGQAPHTGSSGLKATFTSLFGTTSLPLSWSSMRRRSAAISASANSPSSLAISR